MANAYAEVATFGPTISGVATCDTATGGTAFAGVAAGTYCDIIGIAASLVSTAAAGLIRFTIEDSSGNLFLQAVVALSAPNLFINFPMGILPRLNGTQFNVVTVGGAGIAKVHVFYRKHI